MATSSVSPDFDNLLNPVNVRDPFTLYAWLRENSPVHFSKHTNGYLLSRYADVRNALTDTKRFSSQSGSALRVRAETLPPAVRDDFEVGYRFFYDQIQAFDAPVHTLHRSLITKAFSSRVIADMRGRIEKRVHALIDAMERRPEFDFVAEFAYPLPSLVIFDLLGVPEEYYGTLRKSADAFTRFLPATFAQDIVGLRHIATTLRETEAALSGLIRRRRREPELDLISELASVREEEAQLSDDAIVVLCNFLLFAGHETTANLLAGSILQLLKQHDLWDRLRRAPESVAPSIDELLRFVSPVLTMGRLATEDIELHRQTIKRGSRVSMMIGSANHDTELFKNPEELVFGRAHSHPIAFGHGVHYCVGALLARTETELALRALLERMPNMQLAPAELQYQPVFFLRALKSLPIRIS